jgi:cbb3-type cytochrome oxidase maturation protein
MESLYILIPLSIVLVLAIGGLLAWSVLGGQFDDLEDEGRRIFEDPEADMKLASRENVKPITPPSSPSDRT